MNLYLDSSALVKLIQTERETAALRSYLVEHRGDARVSSLLARAEVGRVAHAAGFTSTSTAQQVFNEMWLMPIDASLLDRAATIGPSVLRGLDAIHLATVEIIGQDLRAVVTYDRRMREAAEDLGFPTAAPE